MIVGHDPLASSHEVITLFACRDISVWHRLAQPHGIASKQVTTAWRKRDQVIVHQKTKLLMLGTRFGQLV